MEKRILIINTGGTFSSQMSDQGLAPSITGEQILERLGMIDEEIALEVQDYSSLDSANIVPEDWANLAHIIAEQLEAFSGFVIIHGTDTLAYTSAFSDVRCCHQSAVCDLDGSKRDPGRFYSV